MVTRNTPSSSKLKVLIDQLERAAEGAAADRDSSTGMPKDLHSKVKDSSSAAAKDRRQLVKARVIDAKEVVRLQDEREKKDNKAVRAAAREKKKQGTTKELVPRTKSKGKEIEVISLEEKLEEFHLSGGDGYETVDGEAGDTSGLEEEEEDSFVDIDGTPGTRCDQGGAI